MLCPQAQALFSLDHVGGVAGAREQKVGSVPACQGTDSILPAITNESSEMGRQLARGAVEPRLGLWAPEGKNEPILSSVD